MATPIQEYGARRRDFDTRQTAAVDGITQDIEKQNALILKLQNSAGTVSPEDQAILDELQANGERLTASLEALDALNPPTFPTV